ncbi:TetR/AcrR family transcriptional regulator [Nocardioides sp. KR10-350]|uniref:TetR/AcrR family transcriptional regulator n=1 Tax=Nocardioides cheoyonin TaxID=3156615 RepID=UPI0032B507C3
MTQARRRRSVRGTGERLREEIIEATKELLARAGRAQDVSVRAVAEAVGVTTPSIYLHFEDKDALMEAVVIDVFRELDEEMIAAAEGVTDPLERLRSYGLSYVRFALDHPEHYRLATMDPSLKPKKQIDEMLREAAFTHLNAAVADAVELGELVGPDTLSITFELWAAAHGVAALLIAKPELPVGDPMAFADRVLCTTALGHTMAPPDGFAGT